MPNTFKRAQKRLTTALQTIYTCPAGKTALAFLGQAANDNTADVDVTVQTTEAANGNAAANLAFVMTVPVGAILPFIGKGAVPLAPGDTVQAVASANNNATVTLGIVELG